MKSFFTAIFIYCAIIIIALPLLQRIFVMIMAFGISSPVCTQDIIYSIMSPDNQYEAQEQKTFCENGGWGTFITHSILIYDVNRKKTYDILGVDTNWHEENRPRMTWIGPTMLKVIFSASPSVKILTQDVQDVHIEIVYPTQTQIQPQ